VIYSSDGWVGGGLNKRWIRGRLWSRRFRDQRQPLFRPKTGRLAQTILIWGSAKGTDGFEPLVKGVGGSRNFLNCRLPCGIIKSG